MARWVGELNAQDIANTAWAFTTAGHSDAALFQALAMAAKRLLGDFSVQDLANTGWAFATAGEPAKILLDPISVLDKIELQDAKAQLAYYQMSMQCFAVTG